MNALKFNSSAFDKNRKSRYIMVGGFLGAGKTTAIGILAKHLTDNGLRVGLITNDQGSNLVDSAMLRSQGFATEEIPGGCFCCRFNSLVDATKKLIEQNPIDVYIAEPVGSCTDLIATVTHPLRRLYSDNFTIAPVSVLVDPVRAQRILGLEKGGSFSDKVHYIYNKQIEEADLVIISKSDLLDETGLEALRTAIKTKFPGKEVLAVSARNGSNMYGWFARLTSEKQATGKAMEVDYQVYADGEALLGWLNCTVQLAAKEAFAADMFLKRLAGEVQKRLSARKVEVAHLKMTLSPDSCLFGEIAVINLVRNDFVPELSLNLHRPMTDGQLIVNLRAETDPDILDTAVREAMATSVEAFPGLKATLGQLEHFRPGKPSPTHRFETDK